MTLIQPQISSSINPNSRDLRFHTSLKVPTNIQPPIGITKMKPALFTGDNVSLRVNGAGKGLGTILQRLECEGDDVGSIRVLAIVGEITIRAHNGSARHREEHWAGSAGFETQEVVIVLIALDSTGVGKVGGLEVEASRCGNRGRSRCGWCLC